MVNKILFVTSNNLDVHIFNKQDIIKFGVKKENETGRYVLCSKKDKKCVYRANGVEKCGLLYIETPIKIEWYYLFFKINGKFKENIIK